MLWSLRKGKVKTSSKGLLCFLQLGIKPFGAMVVVAKAREDVGILYDCQKQFSIWEIVHLMPIVSFHLLQKTF